MDIADQVSTGTRACKAQTGQDDDIHLSNKEKDCEWANCTTGSGPDQYIARVSMFTEVQAYKQFSASQEGLSKEECRLLGR
jgi:hypothetical protein